MGINPLNKIEHILSNVKGYDYRWITMLGSKPLIFDDISYAKILYFIEPMITNEEIRAYERGDLSKIYASLDLMLMDNIDHFDRIMSYGEMYFFGNYTINGIKYENVPDHIVSVEKFTPTKLWCAAMISPNSTKWEIEHGYDVEIKSKSSVMNTDIFNELKRKDELFSMFLAIRANINDSLGFRETLMLDKISEDRKHEICKKFTKDSNSLNSETLTSLKEYIDYIDDQRLFNSLTACLKNLYKDTESFSLHIFSSDFHINSSHFSMKVSKNYDVKTNQTTMTKDYLSNSYECFIAEPYLKNSIKSQINWCKKQTPIRYNNLKNVLIQLLNKLISTNFREIICVKYSAGLKTLSDNMDTSTIVFSGIFDNVYAKITLRHGKHVVKNISKCLSKSNISEYIINEGYYIFGYKKDVNILLNKLHDNPQYDTKIQLIKDHILSYSIEISKFLEPIQRIYNKYNDNIINSYSKSEIDARQDYKTISSLKSSNSNTKNVIKNINNKLRNKNQEYKTYFQVINQ